MPYDVVTTAAPGTAATVKIGDETVESYDAIAAGADAKAKDGAFTKAVNIALQDGGYPLVRDPAKVADQKLDALVAANPKLALDAAAIRAGDKATVPVDKAIKDKLDHGRGSRRRDRGRRSTRCPAPAPSRWSPIRPP